MRLLIALSLISTLAFAFAENVFACPSMVFSGNHTTGLIPHFSWRRAKREKLKHDSQLDHFDPHLRRHPQQTWA